MDTKTDKLFGYVIEIASDADRDEVRRLNALAPNNGDSLAAAVEELRRVVVTSEPSEFREELARVLYEIA